MGESVRDEVGYIAPIEGLRGLAVLWVLAFHYVVVRSVPFPADPWIHLVDSVPVAKVIARNGYLGVDLFFLITGFLLTLPWFRHETEGRQAPSAREFYIRRMYRILPAYYIQLLFLFFICIPLLRDLTYWKTDLAYYLLNFGVHVAMLQYTTPVTSSSLTLNGALWTLTLEAQYYLLLPLLAPLFVRAPWRSALGLFGIAVAWRWLALHSLGPLVAFETAIGAPWNPSEAMIRHLLGSQLPGYLGHFAVGILAGRAWLRWRTRAFGVAARMAWLAAALIALVVLYKMHTGNVWLGDFNWIFIPLSMGIVMLAFVSVGVPWVGRLLVNAPLMFVGRTSYSAYLYHLPLLLLWNKFAPRDLGWFSLPAYLALVFAAAWASWRWVELPYMRKRPSVLAAARAAADQQRGADGGGLQDGHAPQDVGVAAGVHERAEHERR